MYKYYILYWEEEFEENRVAEGFVKAESYAEVLNEVIKYYCGHNEENAIEIRINGDYERDLNVFQYINREAKPGERK